MERTREFILLFFCLALLFPLGSALGIATDREEYSKGEEIRLYGRCRSEKVEVALINSGRTVFEGEADCIDSYFDLNYAIAFSDPGGIWDAKAYAEGLEKTVKIRVKPVRESQFYLLTFLSPSEGRYARVEDLNISVRVTDAGKNVEGATVVVWDAFGNKRQLTHLGNGIYFLSYLIPPDSAIGPWKILVAAEKAVEGQDFGGENSRVVDIEKGLIKISVVKPIVKNFQIGSELAVELKAEYLNGTAPVNAVGLLSFSGESHEMRGLGNSTFAYSLPLAKEDAGVKKIVLTVRDEFGNEGSEEIDVTVSESQLSLLADIVPYAVGLLAVGLAVVLFVMPKLRAKKTRMSHAKQKKDLEGKIEKLQKDYFERGKVSKESYNRKIAELETALREVKKKLK